MIVYGDFEKSKLHYLMQAQKEKMAIKNDGVFAIKTGQASNRKIPRPTGMIVSRSTVKPITSFRFFRFAKDVL